MSVFSKSRWLKGLGVGMVALLGIGATTLAPTAADARVFVSFGVPGFGYGYPYAYPAYGYGRGYYGYPYGGVTFGFGGGHHHYHHHHH